MVSKIYQIADRGDRRNPDDWMSGKWEDFWGPNFITYRRYLLDRFLENNAHLMKGIIVDLGGKRERRRGMFSPPKDQVEKWLYINIAPETKPDILADVTDVPLLKGSADCIICTEVLEHLADPAACVSEVYRLLKPGGHLIASVPFLYPIHADPCDYYRFAADGLKQLFRSFTKVTIEDMGGYMGTIGMLIEQGLPAISGWRPIRGGMKRTLIFLSRILYWLDMRNSWRRPDLWRSFSSGYFVIAVK